MRLVINVLIGILVAIVCGGAVLAQDTHLGSLATEARTGTTLRSHRGAATSSITAENRTAYYVGVGFEDAKRFIAANKQAEAIVSVVYLWNDLAGTPEASTVQFALRDLLHDKRMATMKLEIARRTFEFGISSEQRWYYDAGKNYSQMSAHLEAREFTAFILTLAEYGKLGKVAPAGVPTQIVAAFVKLGEYSSKTTLTESDVAALGQQLSIIHGLTKS